jgi:hypothetical protein
MRAPVNDMEVSMQHSRLAALGSAAVATVALAAGPAVAQGAVIAAPACVGGLATGLTAGPLQGSGFAPNSTVTISANGSPFTTAPADAAGNFSAQPLPPVLSRGRISQTFQLTASDGTNSAATPLHVTKWFAKLPKRARADHKVKFRAYGFLPGKRVYVFVRRQGHTLGRFSLGKANVPCGNTTRRLRYMPLRHHTTGEYNYFFEQSRRFSTKKPRIRLTTIITLFFH